MAAVTAARIFEDPYRALFDRLSAGAARCRLVLGGDRVTDVEILHCNAAFEAVRSVLPHLFDVFSRVRQGTAESLQLRIGRRVLAVSAYPTSADEVMVVIDDVTEREELEHRSKASQDRFEQAFNGNAAAMVIAKQDDLRIIDVNPRWLEMFGATREEVIGRTSVELGLISAEDATTRIAQHRQYAAGYDIELALRRRDGTPIVVLASAKPIVIADGPCTLTTLLDITARKQAEEAFALAFSASPAGMMLVHATTDTIVAVNERIVEMTGHPREYFVGHRSSEIRLIRVPAREVLLAEIARHGRLDSFEVELARADGGGLWTIASTEVVTLHATKHRLTAFTDISDRKRAEQTLREINSELERRVRERTRELETTNRDLEAFTSSVSHDLRAPLRTMSGFSEMLLEDFAANLPAEAQGLLTRIHASGTRLRSLIEDLLAFSRLGRNALARVTVDLDAMVRDVVSELLAGRAGADRVDLSIGPLGTCSADPSLLRSVWTNLIDNALKYSRTRDRIEIQIGCEDRAGTRVYVVQDNGVGFDPRYADRLFGMFQRLHSSSEFEGSGVGLANVRRIVERHHGTVAASSELGHGSRFEFTLGQT